MAPKVRAPIIQLLNALPIDSPFSLRIINEDDYRTSNVPIRVKCIKCNRSYNTKPDILMTSFKKKSIGCKFCDNTRRSARRVIPLSTIKNKFTDKFGNKFEYPNLEKEYKGISKPITIKCPIHGTFNSTPIGHLQTKHGCQKCGYYATKLSKEQVLEDFAKAHPTNFYEYSKVIYSENSTVKDKVTIICPVHGEFQQTAHAHKKGQGCASCASNNGGVSFKALTWLDHIAETEKINIIHAGNRGEYKLPHSNYRADGFCKETNTVYEFHGDLFHGNINRFDPNAVLNPFRPGMTIQELYDRTLKREEEIRQLGYNLVTIWESDYDALQLPLKRYDGLTTFKTITKRLDDLDDLFVVLLDDNFISTEHKHNWECKICKKPFKMLLNKIRIAHKETGRIGCSVECTRIHRGEPTNKAEHRFMTKFNEAMKNGFNLLLTAGQEFKGMNVPLLVECQIGGHEISIKPVSIERAIDRGTCGCRQCFYDGRC